MITHQGIVKLMDFGIAKIQRITSMTQTGMFMGSPSYMSPEQVRGRDVDHRSDIYSLGVLFYELITGRLPFTGSSTADIAMRILNGDFAHPRFIMAGVPDAIDKCIVQCMSIQPENRPQAIELVGDSIENLLHTLGMESSRQELERCFKDPKAYGNRLAKILRVSEPKQEPTVLIQPNQVNNVAKWNSEAINSPIPRPDINNENSSSGSERRDHLLPPRTIPHLTKKTMSAELIAAHLPERRHQQRATEHTRIGNQNISHRQNVNSMQNTPAKSKQVGAGVNNGKNPLRTPPAPPRHQAAPAGVQPINNMPRPIRPVSRIVPPAPKRQHRQIRYVPQEPLYVHESSGTFSKFVVGLLLIASATLIWLGNTRSSHHPRGSVATTGRIKKLPQRSTSGTANQSPSTPDPTPKKDAVQEAPSPLDIVANTEKTSEPLPKFAQKNQETPKRKPPPKRETDAVNPRPTTTPIAKAENRPLDVAPIQEPKPETKQDNKQKTKFETKRQEDDQNAPFSPARSKTEAIKPRTNEIDKQKITIISAETSPPTKPSEESEAVPQVPQRRPNKSPGKFPDPEKSLIKVQVSISSAPAAELFIDGRRQGTTNDNGTSSDWIQTTSGQHRVELRRAGFVTRKELLTITTDPKQRFGPYSLQRGETTSPSPGAYKLTISTNLPPVEVTIINIESNATQTIMLTQNSKTITLDKGIYDVTMNRKGDLRKRRLDFTGASQQLTFGVEFREPSN